MIKKLLFVIALLAFWGCPHMPEKPIEERQIPSDSNVSQSDTIVVEQTSENTINISKLKEAFDTKNEAIFLEQFPKSINQFRQYFGWNQIQDVANPLYEESYAYIDYWFRLIYEERHRAYAQNIISISKDAIWEPDAVNYFQDISLDYIKNKPDYNLINQLEHKKAASTLFFLFDGPYPKYDSAFASYLTPEKKELLIEVFETAYYDKENVDRNYDEDFLEKLSYYQRNDAYFMRDIDINNDNVIDKVVSHKRYQGDELVLFVAMDDTYKFAVKTRNFSEDGGHIIDDITQSENGFTVKTYFPDGGLSEAQHFISYKNLGWTLTNSVYKTQSSNQEDAFIYVCDVKQNVGLRAYGFSGDVKHLPEASEREKECSKQPL